MIIYLKPIKISISSERIYLYFSTFSFCCRSQCFLLIRWLHQIKFLLSGISTTIYIGYISTSIFYFNLIGTLRQSKHLGHIILTRSCHNVSCPLIRICILDSNRHIESQFTWFICISRRRLQQGNFETIHRIHSS